MTHQNLTQAAGIFHVEIWDADAHPLLDNDNALEFTDALEANMVDVYESEDLDLLKACVSEFYDLTDAEWALLDELAHLTESTTYAELRAGRQPIEADGCVIYAYTERRLY